jgi:hypothetical protein
VPLTKWNVPFERKNVMTSKSPSKHSIGTAERTWLLDDCARREEGR